MIIFADLHDLYYTKMAAVEEEEIGEIIVINKYSIFLIKTLQNAT
jgi:hypothetical protein